ncbi:Amino Acid-Polyamine-Organocation (APC) Family, partial [Thraustotheca clavata]
VMGFLDNLFRTKPIEVIEAEERKEELPRELGLRDLIMIGIGSTVGSGVFATTGDIISGAAGPAAFIGWLIAGFSCILSGFAYMEMSSLIPSSGSTYAYSYHILGELPAVVGAWLLTLEYGVAGAGVARSWGTKVQQWLQEGSSHPSTYDWLNEPHYSLLASLIMVVSVAILLVGIKFGKFFINIVTGTKILVVIFIIIAGFTATNVDNLSPFIPPRDEAANKYGFQGMMLGASQAFFGYVGFDEVCCLAAEAKDPRRIMPRAVIGTILGTMCLSAFASLALSGMMKYNETPDQGFYFSAGFQNVGYMWASTIVHFGEVCTMPIVVLISFLAQPRLMYAMSVDGLLPEIFGRVDKNGNLFWCTVLSGIFFTLVALLVPFDYLWNIVSFGILFSFNMTNSALILARTREASPTKAYKLTGIMVTCSCIAMFFFEKGYVEVDAGGEGYLIAACILLVIVLLLATTIYLKCPQKAGPIDCYRAPFVPFSPILAITINWYLIAQLPARDIGYGFVWIGAAILSYFAYGYRNSAGKTGWKDMLQNHLASLNEVRPSITSMITDQTGNVLPGYMPLSNKSKPAPPDTNAAIDVVSVDDSVPMHSPSPSPHRESISSISLAHMHRGSSNEYAFDVTFDTYRPKLPTIHGHDVMNGLPTSPEKKWQWEQMMENRERVNMKSKWDAIAYALFRSSWIYLALLGVMASVTAFGVDAAVYGITELLNIVTNLGSNYISRILLYVGYRVCILMLGVTLTFFICPNAAGSGIPEMRSILGGFVLPHYLSGQALVAKFLGLTFALGSGLSIGKEGPFVHLSCIIANQLLRLNWFRDIKRSPDLTHHALSAACAVGVTAAFGTPIGGVLFSIEVTTTYYMTSNYWRAFFCSVIGVIMFRWLNSVSGNDRDAALFTTKMEFHSASFETIFFLFLAIVCGILAGIFVKAFSWCVAFRRRHLSIWGTKPFKFAAAVGCLFAIIDYAYGNCMLISSRSIIDDMFLAKDLNHSNHTILYDKNKAFYGSSSLPLNLSLFFIIRFFATAISATVAIPNGIFTPVFALGAVLGRLFGEFLAYVAPHAEIVPAGYAIVGAASFTAGVTGTFSIAVIVFELTQQLTYMIPVLLAVLLGRAIAGFISLDMYETIARDKSLPQWPDLTRQASYSLVASDLMQPMPPFVITRRQTREDLATLLQSTPEHITRFPVVDETSNMIFLGVVDRDEVEALLQSWNHCVDGAIVPRVFGLSPPSMARVGSMGEFESSSPESDKTMMTPRSRHMGLTSQLAVAGLTPDQAIALRINTIVDLVGCELLSLDAENVHVHRDTFASKVILLISVHKTPELYVTGKGRLLGVIYASDLVARSRFFAL